MSKKEVLARILREYSQVLEARRDAADRLYRRALEAPEFAALEREIAGLEIQIARDEALFSKDTSADNARLAALQSKRAEFLRENGFLPSLPPLCPDCGGTGRTAQNGGLCACVRRRLYNELVEQSGIPLPRRSFEQASAQKNTQKNTQKMAKIYQKMRLFCTDFPDTKYKTVLICGDVGVGKTYLVSCMADDLLQKNVGLLFLSAFRLGELMLKYHLAPPDAKSDILSPVLDAEMLIVDDLGTEPMLNNVTLEYLFLIISEREGRGLHTALTTNLDLAALQARYGSRIFSRLCASSSCVVSMTGDDLRLGFN